MSFLRRVAVLGLGDWMTSLVFQEELRLQLQLLHIERSLLRWFGHLNIQDDFEEVVGQLVRMAEWSKAPDSRIGSFQTKGTSGLQMEAWVQIPLLTSTFFT